MKPIAYIICHLSYTVFFLLLLSCKTTAQQALQEQQAGGVEAPFELLFRDGSTMWVRQISLEQSRFSFFHPTSETKVSVPVSSVHILYTKARTADAQRSEWDYFLQNKNTDDLFVYRSGEGAGLNELATTILGIADSKVRIADREAPLALEKAEGLVFFKSEKSSDNLKAAKLDTDCWVRTKKQELIFAESLKETTSGLSLQLLLKDTEKQLISLSIPKDDVVDFQCPEPGVDLLSSIDLSKHEISCEGKPISPENINYALCIPKPLKNESLMEGSVSNNKGRPFSRGVLLVSTTKLQVYFDKPYKVFEFVPGKAAMYPSESKVELVVSGSNGVLFQEVLDQKSIPKPQVLDVSGLKKITIEVRDGGDGFLGDFLVLGDAKLRFK